MVEPVAGALGGDDPPPRRRVIRDPVHDYVEVPGELEALLASPAVQRLRTISQTSRADTRYPSLNGSRYEHALGTMHLARAGWESAWRNCDEQVRPRFAREVVEELRGIADPDPCTARWLHGAEPEQTPLWGDFPRVVGLVVAAVGLLHDLGHPPFSHTLEDFYRVRIDLVMGPEAGRRQAEYAADSGHAQFHEWAGLQIFDAMPDECFTHLPRAFVRTVLSDRSGDDWSHCLHGIIDGQFDVDRLDYLMRDGLRAGTELGSIDSRRLVDSLELHELPEGWRIGLGARAISAFETMLVQRAQHYRWVVHHHAGVAADAALTRCAEGIFDLAGSSTDGPASRAVADLAAAMPDLDYVAAATAPFHTGRRCRDDADFLTWLRDSRRPLTRLAESADPELATRARTLLRLHDICDGYALEPVPAWRNYHELLARAEQNPGPVADLVERAPVPEVSAYLMSSASRQAAAIMLAELPARLNAVLGALLEADHEAGARRIERQLTAHTSRVEGLGEGFWLVQPVGFLAVREEFATVWRGNEESPLSEVSPFPLALTMIEVMRPRCFVYFVPFEGTGQHAGKEARRAVGHAFFHALADLRSDPAAP